MKKRTLAVRANRLKFIRFLHTEYGLNIQTAYAKIRDWRVKEWELKGIAACIREYDGSFRRPFNTFYDAIKGSRQPFLDFMLEKGMCTKTASIRFRNFDFTVLEMEGLNEAYRKFLLQHPDVEKESSDEITTDAK